MYFIDLTYQEYCIAQHISTLSEKEQKAFVQDYRYKPQFHLVLRMCAGCIAEKTNKNFLQLETFFGWLYEEPVDVVGSYQTELVLSCLEECCSPQLEEAIGPSIRLPILSMAFVPISSQEIA